LENYFLISRIYQKNINKKVTAIPNSAFYSETNAQIGSRFARFCFAKKNEILIEACKRL